MALTGKLLEFQRRDLKRVQQPQAKSNGARWVVAGCAIAFAVLGALSAWVR